MQHSLPEATKKVHIEPAGHRVVVFPDPVEEVSKGGIVVVTPDRENQEKRHQQSGTVVAIGNQAFKAFCQETLPDGSTKWGDPWVKVGDRVTYVRWAGRFVKDPVTEIDYLVMNDSDITARFTA